MNVPEDDNGECKPNMDRTESSDLDIEKDIPTTATMEPHSVAENPPHPPSSNISVVVAHANAHDDADEKILLQQYYYKARQWRRHMQHPWTWSIHRYNPPLPPWILILAIPFLDGIQTDIEYAQLALSQHHLAGQHISNSRWLEYQMHRRQINHPNTYHRWLLPRGRLPLPLFTIATFLMCTILLLVTLHQNGWVCQPWNTPFRIEDSSLLAAAVLHTPQMVLHHQWYRLLTAAYLHLSIEHWFWNMGLLICYGTVLEYRHGTIPVACVYMVSVVGANLVPAYFLPQTALVGASGGIFALMGMALMDVVVINWDVLDICEYTDRGCNVRWVLTIAIFFEMVGSIMGGFDPSVNQFAHIAGLFFGFTFSAMLSQRLKHALGLASTSAARRKQVGRILCFICGTVSFLLFLVLLIMNDGGTDMPCPQCTIITCIPFPFWVLDNKKWWTCHDM